MRLPRTTVIAAVAGIIGGVVGALLVGVGMNPPKPKPGSDTVHTQDVVLCTSYALIDAALHHPVESGRDALPAIAPLRESVQRAGGDVAALVAAFVNGMAGVIERHPWLPAVWVREVVSEGGALRDLLVERIGPSIAHLMAARFAAAQARGELNPALDPRLLMVSLIGLTLFPAAGAPIWRRLYAADDLGVDDLRRHALALLDTGLELEVRDGST